MDFSDRFRKLADRLIDRKPHIRSEEATKHSLVVPFIRDLGYDIYNPAEVVPEYTADIDTKKGEKVDYAILKDGKPIFLIECKDVSVTLSREHRSQLTRYFMVTPDARYAILTNGLVYQFFTELDEKNRMDITPFLTIDMENLDDRHLKELERFTKDAFDADKIFSSARELRFMREIGDRIAAEFREPTEQFVRHFAKQVYSKPLTQARMEEFTRFVREALRTHVNDQVRSRLQSAMLPDSDEGSLPGDKHTRQSDVSETEEKNSFSKLRNWSQTVENNELHMLLIALHDYVMSLGNDVSTEVSKHLIALKRRGWNAVAIQPRPRDTYLRVRIRFFADVALQDGFIRDVRNVGGPTPKGLEITIRNSDDLERAKPLIRRSYDETG